MEKMSTLVSLEDMKDFLGESGDYNDRMISEMILSAQEELYRATGKDFRRIPENETAKRVVRMTVWLSFFADRDDAKNAAYIAQSRDRLITQLQYGKDVELNDPTT